MITEDYVNFETAKLLKEKGFNVVVNTWYIYYSKSYVYKGKDVTEYHHYPLTSAKIGCDVNHEELYDSCVSAPTLQMAMKWLREVYNIHITAVPNGIGEDVFYMGIYRKYDYGWTYISDCLDEKYKEAEFHTPEEACEAAIKYCLENLI